MELSTGEAVTCILNATIEAVDAIVPDTFQKGAPRLDQPPLVQSDLGVIVGITGDLPGRLYVSSSAETFSQIAMRMYGMEIPSEMVHSFVSEFGNTLAGNMVRLAEGLTMDISPPTTLEGGTKLYGFAKAILVPLCSDDVGSVNVALILESL